MTSKEINEGIKRLIQEESISQRMGIYALQTLKAGDLNGALRIVAVAIRTK
jgi:hypothetical protein